MKKITSLFCLFTILILIGCNKTNEPVITSSITTQREEIEMISIIKDVYSNKSRYNPNEQVVFTVELHNQTDASVSGYVRVSLSHLNNLTVSANSETIEVGANIRQSVNVQLTTPSNDYTGYNVIAEFVKSEDVVDLYTSALDVSSEWDKFPRYGYLVNFAASDATINSTLSNLNKYHITGLQYYDWQYKHHMPVGYDEQGNVMSSWLDIANRKVLASTVTSYIDKAHEYNIKSMNYNLLFGAYEDFAEDNVKAEWGLYKYNQDGFVQDYHGLPGNWQTSKIMLMDPANLNWQNYIFNNMQKSFEAFNFDGWHVDQLGSRGDVYDFNRNRVDLVSGYADLLINAKKTLNVDLVFNAVDGYSQSKIATDVPVDFLYHEVWSAKSYRDLKMIIDTNYRLTNNQKTTVLAAYMNYLSSHSKGLFNTHSVLLTNAAIFASGGSHLELGDTGMLGNEYFPNSNLAMSIELKEKLRKYYDFLVAYQNLLRDNVTENTARKISIENVRTSSLGLNDTVWYFVKNKDNHEVLHLINILGNQNDWRDDSKLKQQPDVLENVKVKYYINQDVKNISIATPDDEFGLLNSVEYTQSQDDKGMYVEFTLPKLEYWDMVVITK